MGCRITCEGSVSGFVGQTNYADTARVRLLIGTTDVNAGQSRHAVSVPAGNDGGIFYVSMAPKASIDDPYCSYAGSVTAYLKYAMNGADVFYIFPVAEKNTSATLTCEVFRY